MIYLYGLTEPAVSPPDCVGLDDEPLIMVDQGEVAGLVSCHERGGFAPAPEALWGHDRVVEAAMQLGPVLPARFNTTFEDAAALASVLEREGVRLRQQLERVRGCVELAVRVAVPNADVASAQDGREYLREMLARRQRRDAAAESTLVPLAAYALRWQRAAAASDTATLTASYLVPAADVDQFADQVRVLARQHSELSLSCTGPWPPYSFAEDNGSFAEDKRSFAEDKR